MNILLPILLLIVGLTLLIKGADWLVNGATALATRLKIPPIIIGLTIVAFGTSLPELTVSLNSAFNGAADMSVGNILGSNIANILLILGVCILIGKVAVPKLTMTKELPFLALATVLCLILTNDVWHGANANFLGRFDGVVFIICFIGFLLYVTWMSQKNKPRTKNETTATKTRTKTIPLWKILGSIALGLVCLIGGGTLAVNNATTIAAALGMSEALISLTILAVGTGAPELITSIIATRRGHTDLAIGNVVGSNIFNLLLILGLTSVIKPISFNSIFNLDLIIGLCATLALILGAHLGKKRVLSKWLGVIFLVAYFCYTWFLISRG